MQQCIKADKPVKWKSIQFEALQNQTFEYIAKNHCVVTFLLYLLLLERKCTAFCHVVQYNLG